MQLYQTQVREKFAFSKEDLEAAKSFNVIHGDIMRDREFSFQENATKDYMNKVKAAILKMLIPVAR